jgi:hypothetical protein
VKEWNGVSRLWLTLKALSFFGWLFAIVLATYSVLALPARPRGEPLPGGCFFMDALFLGIECRQTGADSILGPLLSWSFNWTLGAPWGVLALAVMTFPRGVLLLVAWLGSFVLAVLFATNATRRFLLR